MFGFKQKQKEEVRAVTIPFSITAPVLFHKECNGLAEHGKLCATHATLKIEKFDGVRFAFDGIAPPQMTAEVMAYITDQAERKGYVVHHLHSYVTVLPQVPSPVLRPRNEMPAPVLNESPTHTGRGVSRNPRKPFGPRAAA